MKSKCVKLFYSHFVKIEIEFIVVCQLTYKLNLNDNVE